MLRLVFLFFVDKKQTSVYKTKDKQIKILFKNTNLSYNSCNTAFLLQKSNPDKKFMSTKTKLGLNNSIDIT